MEKPTPSYTGMKQHNDESGFSLWLPVEWHEFDLVEGRNGVLFSPYADDVNTGIYAEKARMPVNVVRSDLPILKEAFMKGILALDGVEIEAGSESEFITDRMSFFELRYSFNEGSERRKRWIRNIYWGKNNYVLIAQGRTPQDFAYWLPMFTNIMLTAHI